MPCDTQRDPGQTLSERKKQISETVADLARQLAAGTVKPVIGPQGAITFAGWTNRNKVTDACAYRRLMATGSTTAKMKIAQAERLAGRSVDRRVVAAGVHSHDGGRSWGTH